MAGWVHFADGMHISMKDFFLMASCILVKKSGALNTNEDRISGGGLVRDELRAPPEDANMNRRLGTLLLVGAGGPMSQLKRIMD
jgi:hypothetical protein